MNASTEVPVFFTPEAEARLAELGLRPQAEQMIVHLREVVPGLAGIDVEIAECYDSRDETGVTLTAYSDRVFEPGNNTSWDLTRWAVEAFPPQVLEHLGISFSPGRPDAR